MRPRVVLSLLTVIVVLSLACNAAGDDQRPAPAPSHYHIARENPVEMSFDQAGVRTIDYAWGLEYNPLSVARLASASYAHGDYDTFWVQVSWLMENKAERGGFTVWPYRFDYEPYNARAPWISGMVQGEAMVVMIQAYSLTGDTEYLRVARRVLWSFLVPVEMRGALRPGFWYEQYASPSSDFTKVLNGHLFAVEGLEYYWRYTGSPLAKALFERGLDRARLELPNFDIGGWSAYDGSGKAASATYNGVVVRQLWHFWEVTGDPLFFEYASRWQPSASPPAR